MASSSSSTSSTSSSSSASSTPSAARVLPTRAAAPAASAPLGVATGASASEPNFAPSATAPGVASGATASASALNVATASSTLGVSCSIRPPAPREGTSWGGKFKNVPAPTNFLELKRRAGRPPNPAGLFRTRNSGAGSQNVSRPPSQEQDWAGWQTAADPTSTSVPSKWSAEASSSSQPSAWSKRPPWLPPIPTDTRPASATSSSSTPSTDITLVPNASGSAPAVATSALNSASSSAPVVVKIVDAAPEPDATITTNPSAPVVAKIVDAALEQDVSTSTTPSAPVVVKIVDAALEPDANTSTTPSAPGVAKIVDAALEPDASACTTPSSAPAVTTTIADPSATTSASGAASTTIPSLRNNWVAIHWGIVPRPVERRPEQQASGGNGMPRVEALSRPYLLCPWREQVPTPSFGVRPCWDCRDRPARVVATPCGHLAICVRCYCCYANRNRFVCPCGSPITWLLWH